MKSALYSLYKTVVLSLLVSLATGLCSTQVLAQGDAFSIEVAVSQRSQAEEQDAYKAGLRRILLNNSGDKTILNRDLIRQGLRDAENYVQSFSYRRPSPGTVIASDTPITASVQQSGQATQLMLVSFDRTLVNQLISDSAPANAGRSNEPEPAASEVSNSALVWMVITDQDRDILLSDEAANNVRQRAREIAGQAGISLVYPTGDDEDRQLLMVVDPATQMPVAENIAAAAQRYAQTTVLVAYLQRADASGWSSQWMRFDGDQQQVAEFDTPSLDQALQQGLGILGSAIEIDTTYRYGGPASSDIEGLVWVGSLDSTEDYATMMRFFEGVDAVGTVYAKEVQPSSMVFSIVPRSALVDIESALFDVTWLQRSAPPVDSDPTSLLRNVDLAIEYGR